MEEVSKKLGSKGILDDEGEASCCWKKNIAVQQRQHCENEKCDRGIIAEKAFLARSEF